METVGVSEIIANRQKQLESAVKDFFEDAYKVDDYWKVPAYPDVELHGSYLGEELMQVNLMRLGYRTVQVRTPERLVSKIAELQASTTPKVYKPRKKVNRRRLEKGEWIHDFHP